MAVMAQNHNSRESRSEDSGGRTGRPFTFWMNEELAAAMDRYLASQPVKPSKTAFFHAAVSAFLERSGFWPEKE